MGSDGLREDVEAEPLQDSHTMVKAGLLEVQSPDGLMVAPPIQRLPSVLCCTLECAWVRSTFRSKRRASTKRFKAMKRQPTVCSHVSGRRNAGFPTSRETHGNGVPVLL